jgi:hypothetical protein
MQEMGESDMDILSSLPVSCSCPYPRSFQVSSKIYMKKNSMAPEFMTQILIFFAMYDTTRGKKLETVP